MRLPCFLRTPQEDACDTAGFGRCVSSAWNQQLQDREFDCGDTWDTSNTNGESPKTIGFNTKMVWFWILWGHHDLGTPWQTIKIHKEFKPCKMGNDMHMLQTHREVRILDSKFATCLTCQAREFNEDGTRSCIIYRLYIIYSHKLSYSFPNTLAYHGISYLYVYIDVYNIYIQYVCTNTLYVYNVCIYHYIYIYIGIRTYIHRIQTSLAELKHTRDSFNRWKPCPLQTHKKLLCQRGLPWLCHGSENRVYPKNCGFMGKS